MALPVYATRQNLIDYEGITLDEAAAAVALGKASGHVRRALKTARYAVDESGNATDPDVIEVLARATCAQVAYAREIQGKTGGTSDAASAVSGGSIDGVSLPTARTDGTVRGRRDVLVSVEVFDTLHSTEKIRWSVSF